MMMQGVKNPQALINQAISNNPKLNNLINECGTPEKAFRKMASDMGYDPDELINILK